MDSYNLVRPSCEHEKQYMEMMDEWETYGGRLNPGALRRYIYSEKREMTYIEWLKFVEDNRYLGHKLYFFLKDNKILGAISIRLKNDSQENDIGGHIGYGIRPSERKKGYATKMLSMVLPKIKQFGISPIVITCDKDNVGSAKTILNNGGVLVKEVVGKRTGNLVQLYHINL